MSRLYRSLLLLCTLIFFANGKPQVHRLGKGSTALSSKYQPYTVAVKQNNEYYTCSGTIISPTKILTSAYCVVNCVRKSWMSFGNCSSLTVYTGSPSLTEGGNFYNVESITIPDDFIEGKLNHDIAVLTLTTAIEYSDKQKPIGLPDKDIVDNSYGVTSGWGVKLENYELDDNLQAFKKKVVTAATCNSKYYFHGWETELVNSNDFCAISHIDAGFCWGDAGSPLIQDEKIIGILSWGEAGCTSGRPTGYTNVYKYLEFIKKELQ